MAGVSAGHWCLTQGIAMSDVVKLFSSDFKIEYFDESVTSTTLLDDFDHDLWHAGEILLLTSKNILKLYGRSSVTEQENVSAKMRFWWEMPDGKMKILLKKRIDLRALMPVAELGVASQEFVLRNDDEKIVVRGEFSALTSNLAESVSEAGESARIKSFLILRGLRGYDEEFNRAGKMIEGLAGSQLSSLSFKLRIQSLGFAFAKKSSRYGISAGEPVEKAIREMSLLMLRQARINEPGVIEDIDSEFLHQFRVSLRKARSLINLMKKAFPAELHLTLKTQMGELASATNQLRDLDVFLLEKGNYAAMLPENFQDGVDSLFKKIAVDREKARKAVASVFQSKAFHESFASIFEVLEHAPIYATKMSEKPIKQVADKKIHDCYERIRQKGLLINDLTPSEQVHDLRIEGKKLRYLMEFFAELYPAKSLKPLLKALKQLQGILGDFNDFDVQKRFLADYEKTHRKSPALSAAINGLIAVLHQKQMAARSQVMQAFADFNQDETIAAFERLFNTEEDQAEQCRQQVKDLESV